MGMVVEMLDVCIPLIVFLFTYIDVVLLLKFSGMRPLTNEIQQKLPELGLYVLIFPYLLLFVYVGILESIALGSGFLAGAILVVVVFIALILNEQVKNRQEAFKKLSSRLDIRLITLNAIILGIVSGIVSISICGIDVSIAWIALPLGAYMPISWRCLHVMKSKVHGKVLCEDGG